MSELLTTEGGRNYLINDFVVLVEVGFHFGASSKVEKAAKEFIFKILGHTLNFFHIALLL